MRVIFYTGKGGSGKSVISCATALKLSELGYETLVISSDPAHTISDALETQVHSAPTRLSGRDRKKLWAIQVDPIREAREKFGVIQEYIVSLFKSKGLDEVLAYEIAASVQVKGAGRGACIRNSSIAKHDRVRLSAKGG